MTDRTEPLTQASAPVIAHEGSYIDWSSILAGAVVASGIAFVFTTFGAAVGLTMASPYEGEGSPIAALVAVGSWMLWTTISSFMAGGYIAGRMRRRIEAASPDEVSIRDGIHGLTVWGAGILLGAVLLSATVDTAAQVSSEAVATVATTETGANDQAAASEPEAATPQATENMSEAEAKAAAEAARQYSVLAAFALAASLLVAGAGAYWAAGIGGQHRDEGRAFGRFGPWA